MTRAVAVIVGVGPGLGSALVRRFAADGMTVIAAARDTSDLTPLQETNGEAVILQDCDVTQPDQVDALFQKADRTGDLQLCVFNAGAFVRASILDIDPEDFERCWRVGTYGGFLTGRAAARRMVSRGEGTIIFTGATASLRGSAMFANLASPKFGLRALAQSMARELGPQGVHVAHAIIDGQIMSERYHAALEERGPDSLLDPDAIAASYAAIHAQRRSAWTFEFDLRPWVEKF